MAEPLPCWSAEVSASIPGLEEIFAWLTFISRVSCVIVVKVVESEREINIGHTNI